MGAVKPGFGPKEPEIKGGRPMVTEESVHLVMQERRERCKQCMIDNVTECCDKSSRNPVPCDMFKMSCKVQACGITYGRWIMPMHERVARQTGLVSPCEYCSRLGLDCKGKKLTEVELQESYQKVEWS
jgi:hypothetical protein